MSRAAVPWATVLDRLSAFYRTGDWRVPYLRDHAETPFQVLIGTILSQRTRDEATDVASARLFAAYPDADALARAPPEDVERRIRTTGFYRTKTRVLGRVARAIRDDYGGTVPRSFEALTALPGVGPKTANCVLLFGYGVPAIPVDTHVHRIANRLGVVRTRSPEETEAALRRTLEPQYWMPLNPLLVQHGQNLCRPLRPRCDVCPIADLCATGRARAAGRPEPRPADRGPPASRAGAPRAPRASGRPSPRAPARRPRSPAPRRASRTARRSRRPPPAGRR